MVFKPKRPNRTYVLLLVLLFVCFFGSSRLRTIYHDEQFMRSWSSHDVVRARDGVVPERNDMSVNTDARYASTVRYCDSHNSTDRGPCLFDIGLNNGQDSKYYLESWSTSRILAIEANPTLVNVAKEKLHDHINSGRLKILNIGLVGNETESRDTRPKLTFWINTATDLFSSFRQKTGCRNPRGEQLPEGNTTYCRKIEMDTMSCSDLIKEYGTPRYMKVDIEGMDRECIAALGNVAKSDRPTYVSKENIHKQDIERLAGLGYTKFKVVNQNRLQREVSGTELDGYSGPWGEDAKDLWIGKQWHSLEQILGRLPLPETIDVHGKQLKGWYDLHAKK